jgi:SAM-dependent methyltransferase
MLARECPCCGVEADSVFYRVSAVPVHTVLLMPTKETALNYPAGDIELAFCRACGFTWNAAFDPGLHKYSPLCEETQAFSPTFTAFHERLANHLIERYDLRGKDILEIGCGKGEFLTLLCETGGNRGLGFDPAYASARQPKCTGVTFIEDFYSEKYAAHQADLVVCKMTLEHIHRPAELLHTVRQAIAERPGAAAFFQVPDATRILRELAFWDIYYEHCSYFSQGSLTRLFHRCGFEVTDFWTDYAGQYLMLEACAAPGGTSECHIQEEPPESLALDVAFFADKCYDNIDKWESNLEQRAKSGRKIVLWGGGSKAAAFLTTMHVRSEVEYVVDVNPFRQGSYLAGTGQEIVAPQFLSEYAPDIVIVMNPLYRSEIELALVQLGLDPEVVVL